MGYGGVTRGKKPGAGAKQKRSRTAQAASTPPSGDPAVIIRFEGLLIGHYDDRVGVYYVGVLPTLGHQFSVLIEEFIQHRTAPIFREPVSKREIEFQEVSLEDRKWTFEVQQLTVLPRASIYLSDFEPQRLDPPQETQDYRWAIRLEDGRDFPKHVDPITQTSNILIEKNALRPVIQFRRGVFYNEGDLISPVFRVPEGQPWEELGQIGETIVANLEKLDPGAKLVLQIERAGGAIEEIFNVTYHPPKQYRITVRNTSPDEQVGSPLSRGHFQIYYLAANTASANRYDLRLGSSPLSGPGAGAPNPYRCGIGDVAQPIL